MVKKSICKIPPNLPFPIRQRRIRLWRKGGITPLITPLYSPLKLRGEEGGLREIFQWLCQFNSEENRYERS